MAMRIVSLVECGDEPEIFPMQSEPGFHISWEELVKLIERDLKKGFVRVLMTDMEELFEDVLESILLSPDGDLIMIAEELVVEPVQTSVIDLPVLFGNGSAFFSTPTTHYALIPSAAARYSAAH